MRMEDKHTPAFSDTDLMFFGKYINLPLQDVDPRYLLWCWEDAGYKKDAKNYSNEEWLEYCSKNKPYWQNRIKLANYIWNSMDAFELELKRD